MLFEARGASEVRSQAPELCAVFACELVRPIISVLRRSIGGIALSFSLILKEGSIIYELPMPTFDQESIESSIDDAVVDDYELPMPTFDQESIESMCCQVVTRTMPKSITSNTFANSIRLCISLAHTELLVREIHQQLFAEGFVEDPATARWQNAATALHVPNFYFG